MPIRSFADQTTADIWDSLNTRAARRIPQRVWSSAKRRLSVLHAVTETRDIAELPGNRFEPLQRRPGFFSVRVNDQFRVVFRFEKGEAHDVQIIDYHR